MIHYFFIWCADISTAKRLLIPNVASITLVGCRTQPKLVHQKCRSQPAEKVRYSRQWGHDWQKTVSRRPPPIFFVFTYVALEKLSDTRFSLSVQIGFLEIKTAPENWGTKHPLNCSKYNSGIFYNETKWRISSWWEIKNVIFLNLLNNFLWGWTTPNFFFKIWKNYMLLAIIK